MDLSGLTNEALTGCSTPAGVARAVGHSRVSLRVLRGYGI